jgi:nicotinamidase-related amidase
MNEEPSSPVALLLIDVINGLDFEGCESLVQAAGRAAPRILALRDRARAAGVPIIYVNDNFGRWRSDFRSTVDACSKPDQPGHRVTQLLTPEPSDYFVLKPRHSGFFCTALELLLDRLQTKTLVLVGFATNICVLFTANDAHMRGYDVIVPRDCTASNSNSLTAQALEQLRLVMSARTDESTSLDFKTLGREAHEASTRSYARHNADQPPPWR